MYLALEVLCLTWKLGLGPRTDPESTGEIMSVLGTPGKELENTLLSHLRMIMDGDAWMDGQKKTTSSSTNISEKQKCNTAANTGPLKYGCLKS